MQESGTVLGVKKENVSTVLAILALIGIIAGGGAAWSDVKSALADVEAWQVKHESFHEERGTEARIQEGKNAQRFAEMDVKLQEIPLLKQQQAQTDANLNNVNIRMDKQYSDLNNNIKETRDGVNKLATQVEVLTQILRRMENSRDRDSRSPTGN